MYFIFIRLFFAFIVMFLFKEFHCLPVSDVQTARQFEQSLLWNEHSVFVFIGIFMVECVIPSFANGLINAIDCIFSILIRALCCQSAFSYTKKRRIVGCVSVALGVVSVEVLSSQFLLYRF